MKLLVVLAFSGGALACSGPAEPEGTTLVDQAPQPPPRGRQLDLFDFVPPETSGAMYFDMTRLRAASQGAGLISLVRRIGIDQWEQVLGLNLEQDVARLLLYVVPAEGAEPGDLSVTLETALASPLGIVVQLNESPDGEHCFEGPLSQVEATLAQGVADQMWSTTCGPFVILQRYDLVAGVGPHAGAPAAQTLIGQIEERGPEGLVLSAVVGPSLVNRARCGESTTATLAGWQAAMVEVGSAGVSLRGRYTAAQADQLEALEQCVADGMGGLGGVPLFDDLELDGLLSSGAITRHPPASVNLDITFSDMQFQLMMSVLELVGEGIQ